jgi:hypothetical protein
VVRRRQTSRLRLAHTLACGLLGARIEEHAVRGAEGQLRDCAIALSEYLAGVQVVPEET